MTIKPRWSQPCAGPNSLNPPDSHKLELPAFASRREAALYWYQYGFAVIPLVPKTKQTAVKWDQWLAGLSRAAIIKYWTEHREHDVGFIVGNDTLVLDADAPKAVAALESLEARFEIKPMLVVKTSKGEHHYFRRAPGTYAKSDSHCTARHPERIDVKTGRSMVVLPPSTGKTILSMEGCHAY